jgi:taurine dioxygenase
VEHLWRKGDLVLWDNLALEHARPDVRTEGPIRTLPAPQISRAAKPQFKRVGA